MELTLVQDLVNTHNTFNRDQGRIDPLGPAVTAAAKAWSDRPNIPCILEVNLLLPISVLH